MAISYTNISPSDGASTVSTVSRVHTVTVDDPSYTGEYIVTLYLNGRYAWDYVFVNEEDNYTAVLSHDSLLNHNTAYTWQVKVQYGGNDVMSPVWTFTTENWDYVEFSTNDMLWRKTHYTSPVETSSGPLWVGGRRRGDGWYVDSRYLYNRLYLYYDTLLENWFMSEGQLGPSLYIDGDRVLSSQGIMNGHYYWKLDYYSGQYIRFLWYSSSDSKWYISNQLGGCYGTYRQKTVEETSRYDYTMVSSPYDPYDAVPETTGTHTKSVTKKGNHWEITSVDKLDLYGMFPGYIPGSVYSISSSFTPDDAGDPTGPGTWEFTFSANADFTISFYDLGYTGDSWWTNDSLEGYYEPQGMASSGKEVYLTYDGWILDSDDSSSTPPFGRYLPYTRNVSISPTDPEVNPSVTVSSPSPSGDYYKSPYMYVGIPVWTDQNGDEYPRSTMPDESGFYTYGAIRRKENGGGILGTEGDEAGWYEGPEPSLTSSVTYTHQLPDGSSATPGVDLTITLSHFTQGDAVMQDIDYEDTLLLGTPGVWI